MLIKIFNQKEKKILDKHENNYNLNAYIKLKCLYFKKECLKHTEVKIYPK